MRGSVLGTVCVRLVLLIFYPFLTFLTLSLSPLSLSLITVGKGHREFSSARQQDASEYYMHFLDIMTRSEKASLKKFDRWSVLYFTQLIVLY